MSRIRLYIDEDAMRHALVVALRARHVDVVTALDRGMMGRSDEDHLRLASVEGRVVYSFNIKDFAVLHQTSTDGAQRHAGIVLLQLMNHRSAEDMQGRLEYLSSWSG